MALERLIGACGLGFVAVAACSVLGCETRSVYLVPGSDSLSGEGGSSSGGAAPLEASAPRSSGGTVMVPLGTGGRPDGGRKTDCETNRYPQQPQPLGVYLMVDQMNATPAQWEVVTAALYRFIGGGDQLGSVSVGIQFYAVDPPDSMILPLSQTYFCEPDRYQRPMVPIAPLPDNATLLSRSIGDHGPKFLQALLQSWFNIGLDGSPMDAALRGAIAGASDWATDHASTHSKGVVVLVTDGDLTTGPSPLCVPSVPNAVQFAAEGLAAQPSVSTYVLNVGTPNPEMDTIAAAGGTQHAYSAATASDMVAALQRIRELALPCVVSPPAGVSALSSLLNVELSGPYGSTRFGRVDPADGGAADTNCNRFRANEWYMEGSGKTLTVRLCPSTCAQVRSVKDSTLDVVLGCETTTFD